MNDEDDYIKTTEIAAIIFVIAFILWLAESEIERQTKDYQHHPVTYKRV
jgi:hypothetical protein